MTLASYYQELSRLGALDFRLWGLGCLLTGSVSVTSQVNGCMTSTQAR